MQWTTRAWIGKWFQAHDDTHGRGLNRIETRKQGEKRLLAFETRFEDSRIDRHSCVLLDYDQEENIRTIRSMRDELRFVGNGLLLGRAYMRIGFRLRPISWFALEKQD